MKSVAKIQVLFLILTAAAGCFRNDIRTETFQIAQLRTPESGMQLAQSLRGLSGIRELRSDMEKQTLTVVFDGRELYIKNIEYAIVKAGFDLPHWPADPADKARLPEGMR